MKTRCIPNSIGFYVIKVTESGLNRSQKSNYRQMKDLPLGAIAKLIKQKVSPFQIWKVTISNQMWDRLSSHDYCTSGNQWVVIYMQNYPSADNCGACEQPMEFAIRNDWWSLHCDWAMLSFIVPILDLVSTVHNGYIFWRERFSVAGYFYSFCLRVIWLNYRNVLFGHWRTRV